MRHSTEQRANRHPPSPIEQVQSKPLSKTLIIPRGGEKGDVAVGPSLLILC